MNQDDTSSSLWHARTKWRSNSDFGWHGDHCSEKVVGLGHDVSMAGSSLWIPAAWGLTFYFPDPASHLKAGQLSLLTPEAGRDAGAAASYRRTAAFHQLCQANVPHGTTQQLAWLLIPSTIMDQESAQQVSVGQMIFSNWEGQRSAHQKKPWTETLRSQGPYAAAIWVIFA